VLASCSSDAAVIWDTGTGIPLQKFDMPRRLVWDVAFSPDCTLLATGSSDCLVRLWDVNSTIDLQDPRLLEGHSSAVTAVVFSLNGRLLVSGATNGSVMLWDTTSWTVQEIAASPQKIYAVAFSPDTQTLASCSEYARITLYTTSTERWWEDDGLWKVRIDNLAPYASLTATHDVAFSPNGKLLACGMDTRVMIWEVSSGELLQTLHGHIKYILGLSFSANGRTLTSCGEDKTMRVWRPLHTDTSMASLELYGRSWTRYDRVAEQDAQVDEISAQGSTESDG
jgi:WD40 repeat protein